MVFDATQPTDPAKLRSIGSLIRPNWYAIQTGDPSFKPQAINLDDRTPLGISNDPAAIANSYILYCKEDSSGTPQLYGIDTASHVAQISVGVAPFSSTNGYSWLPGGMLIQWGVASVNAGSNTIAFPVAFSAAAHIVTLTPVKNTATVDNAYITDTADITATQFKCYNSAAGITKITWIAIGPKV